ncbi:MAG: DUF6067 family protein [Bacteroidales bacterium]|nr:DUF6067 family protein [Bacteroidales bacterium]
MKNFSFLLCLFLISCNSFNNYNERSQYEIFSPDGIPFKVASTPWKVDMYGNHRALIFVKDSNNILVELPWRRPDLRPETKKIVVVDIKTGENIENVFVKSLTSEKGEIIFQPKTIPGNYYIYYMPYKYRKGWDDARYGNPWNDYLPPIYNSDSIWVNKVSSNFDSYTKAEVKCFESRSSFDAFTSMGIIATKDEENKILSLHNENPIIFTEDRCFPVRLTNNLPVRWIKNGPSNNFNGVARPNEYYVWQFALWCAHDSLNNVKLHFEDLKSESGKTIIPKENITCFNQEGINWNGDSINFDINIPKDKIQALWCGVQIPNDVKNGIYKGFVNLSADGIENRLLTVEIKIDGDELKDKGDNDLWRYSRLRWLNSTIGIDNKPVSIYKDMILEGNKLIATDKQVILDKGGMIKSIVINDKEVLASPLRFVIYTDKGEIQFAADSVEVNKDDDGVISWKSESLNDDIHFVCNALMEYDGYISYKLKVLPQNELQIKDIRLETDYTTYASEYFMGVGFKGGFIPKKWSWDWKGPWDSYWIGGVDAGLHVEFRGGDYNGPLLNDYKPAPPTSWTNNSKGSVFMNTNNKGEAQVTASTGPETLDKNGECFEFSLLITPVKPVDTHKHFTERYYHASTEGFDNAAKDGANIANIHHARSLNPVINYPFIVQDSLKEFINHEHQFNRKVKIYYTIRELTNHAKEIYALKSLNHEIFVKGVGYGLPWQCEHLIDDYKPAWYTELPNETYDAALVLNGFSRWINYYLEGLRWMFENYNLDGIYMDDVSFDRNVMKRMRKIMDKYHKDALIDLHSNTGYSVGPANQYTDFFPYIDRLWFGESFQYNQMMPDEWLVTFSGIPFGQMSEMLQDGGNRFLGMVYGATARHSYSGSSPAPIWKVWDSFGIMDAKMCGYWDKNSPVKTNNDFVKATSFVKEDKVLISIGNFDEKEHEISLMIDWNKLGFNPNQMKIYAPKIENFQKARDFSFNESVIIEPKKGMIFIIEK